MRRPFSYNHDKLWERPTLPQLWLLDQIVDNGTFKIPDDDALLKMPYPATGLYNGRHVGMLTLSGMIEYGDDLCWHLTDKGREWMDERRIRRARRIALKEEEDSKGSKERRGAS